MAGFSLYDWSVRCSGCFVTILTAWKPKNLLYGKEEHSIPQIEPSALRDQIEDIIFERVRPEYLNTGQGSEKQT